MRKLNALIIGVSGFGNIHYEMLLNQIGVENMRVVAATVVNQKEERVKCASLKRLGAALFVDYKEMLEKYHGEIDICFIPTGLHLHAEMTLAALQAGANVYVEKPLATTVQDAIAIALAAKSCRKYVTVGYQHMYFSKLLELKQRLADVIGEIILLKACSISPRNAGYYTRNEWAGKIFHAGRWVMDVPFHNAGAHELNLMCFLAGVEPAQSVAIKSVRAELYRVAPIPDCDLGGLDITTASGVKILYITAHCGSMDDGPASCPLTIKGSKGTLAESPDGLHKLRPDGSLGEIALPGFLLATPQEIMDRVVKYLSGENVFVCSPAIATPEVICVNGAFESAPIIPVPGEFTSKYSSANGETITRLRGLSRAMVDAFTREQLLGDLGLPWAVAGDTIDMTGYSKFTGGKTTEKLSRNQENL